MQVIRVVGQALRKQNALQPRNAMYCSMPVIPNGCADALIIINDYLLTGNNLLVQVHLAAMCFFAVQEAIYYRVTVAY
ncbi:MAG: hypothetical protein BGO09_08540 [Bacteroidetes bacterium 47-18]|nr:MAG: hypothetical protein BGO09_08535 [Bacteroidetes bacterium 47-18]OJU78415.1 MAG: hypothetical protein BGO09_08540 [Bacteroidetes bacterium 47-18]